MPEPLHVAVVGANGGIGRALIDQLLQRSDLAELHVTSRSDCTGWRDGRVRSTVLDARDEGSVAAWLDDIQRLDWMINTAGLLHNQRFQPEKTIRQFEVQQLQASIEVNTVTSVLLAKHAEPLLKRSDAAVFACLSARVGSIEDNRLGGWISYRASKAALNMALRCIAIEWQRTARNIRVLALHPGTTDTALSRPFQARVPAKQLFSSEKTARLLLQRIEEAHDNESGRFIDYAGETIPW